MLNYLEVDSISKHFGGLWALDKCSFTVERGKITCLVGPNGAGKTTIFNVITGFIPPDEGRMSFEGQALDALAPSEIIRRGIARTFQNLRLFYDMSALDNVIVYLGGKTAFGPFSALARPFRTHAELRRKTEAALAMLEEVGIAHKAHDVARNLSFGQQKLLCIARVLATGAELLLLDEPASGLHASSLNGVVELVLKLRDRGKTLLIVEHNTRVVQKIADEVLFLHQGHLMARGAPDRIIHDPKLAEIYFGGAV
jgi:ABC-type branched-subunit amino acid transport system ATPase component